MSFELLAMVFSGTFFGAFLGPLLLEEYREWKRERRWRKPRKDLLAQKLKEAPGQGWVGIDTLSRLVGAEIAECRTLLIEIDARGGQIRDDQGNWKEGWALIDRRPLTVSEKDGED